MNLYPTSTFHHKEDCTQVCYVLRDCFDVEAVPCKLRDYSEVYRVRIPNLPHFSRSFSSFLIGLIAVGNRYVYEFPNYTYEELRHRMVDAGRLYFSYPESSDELPF